MDKRNTPVGPCDGETTGKVIRRGPCKWEEPLGVGRVGNF